MIIGIDGSRAFVEGKTGTENYSYQLIKHLSQIDTENDYLIYLRPSSAQGPAGSVSHSASSSTMFPPATLREPSSSSPFASRNTTYEIQNTKNWPANFRFKVLNFSRLWTQIGLAKATFEDNLDVLFIPSHTLPLIRKPGLKTVITVHDLGAEYLPGMHQLKQALYLKLMTQYQLKTASKIIAVSEATKKDIMKKVGIKSEKIKVVYEGVDKKVFKQISKDIVDNIVKKYDIERGKYFLFVGTVQPRKNLERLIEAFALFVRGPAGSVSHSASSSTMFPPATPREPSSPSPLANYQLPTTNYKLVIVGQKGWKSDNIYKLPKQLGIEKSICFLGRISDEDLVALYNGAVALTYPSLFEGFGLPILEAFACGCPVITSNVSSMPEVAGKAAILVNPEKESEISDAMRKIAKNDQLRNNLIQLGFDKAKKFNWENTAKQTLKVLEEAAE